MHHSIFKLYKDSFSGLSKDIWILSLVTLINRSGTVVFLFLTIYLLEQLHFTKGQAGIAVGCYGIGSVLGGYIGGILTDKIGYYKVLFYSQISVGVLFFGLIFVTDFHLFCAASILISAVGDAHRPAGNTAISIYSKKENHTRSLSLYRLAINLGFALGGGVAGILAGSYGYHWLFILDGISCILAGLFFVWMLKPKYETKTKNISKADKKSQSPYQDFWYLSFLFFLLLNSIVFMQLFYTFPVFCREILNMTEGQIGGLMTLNGLLLFVIEMPLIYVLVNRKLQNPSIILGFALLGLSFLSLNFLGFYVWVTFVFVILITMGEIVNFPFVNTLAINRSNPNNRGQYMGLYAMTFAISAIISPWLGLKIVELYGFSPLWYLLGLFSAIGTIGTAFLFRGNRSKKAI